jgi:intergrase/recombinase
VLLRRYLDSRDDADPRLFPVCRSAISHIFYRAFQRSGVQIKCIDLRNWFCVEMAKLGVPDRYVDVFCGRTPNSVLARHYTDYSPQTLKEIYDKANLKVLP